MNKKKKLTISIAVLVIVCFAILLIYILATSNKLAEEGSKIDGIELPKNEYVLKDTIVDNLKITNISLLTRKGISTFKAEILNEKESNISIKKLSIIFYENENETKVDALKNTTIKKGDIKYINIESELDLSNITKIEYVLE